MLFVHVLRDLSGAFPLCLVYLAPRALFLLYVCTCRVRTCRFVSLLFLPSSPMGACLSASDHVAVRLHGLVSTNTPSLLSFPVTSTPDCTTGSRPGHVAPSIAASDSLPLLVCAHCTTSRGSPRTAALTRRSSSPRPPPAPALPAPPVRFNACLSVPLIEAPDTLSTSASDCGNTVLSTHPLRRVPPPRW